MVPAQWEVSNRAFDVLKNTTDAKGRKIEVCKIRLPPPQFRNYREAEGLAVSPSGLTVVSSKHNNRMHPAACAVTNNVLLRPPHSTLSHLLVLPAWCPRFDTACCTRLQPDHIEKGYVPRIAGERLPATYINHYTANGALCCLDFTLLQHCESAAAACALR